MTVEPAKGHSLVRATTEPVGALSSACQKIANGMIVLAWNYLRPYTRPTLKTSKANTAAIASLPSRYSCVTSSRAPLWIAAAVMTRADLHRRRARLMTGLPAGWIGQARTRLLLLPCAANSICRLSGVALGWMWTLTRRESMDCRRLSLSLTEWRTRITTKADTTSLA